MKTPVFGFLVAALTLSACSGALSISGGDRVAKVSIDDFDRLSAEPGESVIVSGSNLTDDIQVSVNGKPANFRLINDKSATIELPADIDSGLVKVTFTVKNRTVTSLTLMNKNSIDNLSTLNISLDSICNSFIVKASDGELTRGKANCSGTQSVCSRDGQTDCNTSATFPSVAKAGLATKVLAGKTLAGVDGQASASCGP